MKVTLQSLVTACTYYNICRTKTDENYEDCRWRLLWPLRHKQDIEGRW